MSTSAVPVDVGLTRAPGAPVLLRLRSDEQLVALFRAGNEEAFSVIHDRFQARLLAYVRRMLPPGARNNAEDVLQDVFLRAYGALRADERPIALKAWLYRVAHNRCIDELRRPGPQPTEIVEQEGDPRLDPALAAERRERLRRLVTDLGRLPEQQRSALLMRELEGFSYKELGEALDVSQPAVKSLLVRARMGLAEAAQARDTSCDDIREELACARDRRVRSSARARRHLRDCGECRSFDKALRSTSKDLAALLPGPGLLGMIAGILGGGATASGGAAAGGGIAGVAGGGAVAATATKVAVAVCCVAATAGGAASVEHTLHQRAAAHHAAPATPAEPAATSSATPDPQPAADPPVPAAAPAAESPVPAPVTTPAAADPTAPASATDGAPASAEEDTGTGGVPPDDEPGDTATSTDTPASATPASSVAGPTTTTTATPAVIAVSTTQTPATTTAVATSATASP